MKALMEEYKLGFITNLICFSINIFLNQSFAYWLCHCYVWRDNWTLIRSRFLWFNYSRSKIRVLKLLKNAWVNPSIKQILGKTPSYSLLKSFFNFNPGSFLSFSETCADYGSRSSLIKDDLQKMLHLCDEKFLRLEQKKLLTMKIMVFTKGFYPVFLTKFNI